MSRPELDPEIAAFVGAMQRAWSAYPPFISLPIAEAREVAESVRAPWRQGGPEMAETFERTIQTAAGPLRIRGYNPGVASPAPALLYLHGGGFTLFSLDTHDRLMREYAAAGGFIVVGLDYPLSPETRYPVALDLTVGFIDWLGEHGASLGIDADRVAIGGDSAGGNLSLAAALRLRDRGTPGRLQALLLNYGAFGGPCSDEAEARLGGPGSVLDRAEMDYYFANYVGAADAAMTDPYARPIVADLSNLPPAFLVIPECDILAEQSHAVHDAIIAAGGDATSMVYPGATHSFLEAMSVAEVARRAIADGAAWVKARLADERQRQPQRGGATLSR